jgi:hypothetical protein
MPSLFEPEFEESSDRPGFTWRRALLARQAGGERLGASLFALPPARRSSRSTTTSATRSWRS